eukprot:bmy_13716T0
MEAEKENFAPEDSLKGPSEGGTYFLVLHSLGLELGSSIGIFAFSYAVAVAVHTEHGVQLPNMDPENEFWVVGLVT